MSSDLIELGNRALASVSSNVAGGAPLLKCRRLASEFYGRGSVPPHRYGEHQC